jgi:outer membrane protein
MSSARICAVALAALAASTPYDVSAQVPLSEQDAVEAALRENPTLCAAGLEAARAAEDVVAEENLYAPILVLDGTVGRLETPTILRSDTVTNIVSNSAVLGAGVWHSLPIGTQLQLRLEASRNENPTQVALATGAADTQVGYGLSASLDITQPLLRGRGTKVGRASLRSARAAKTQAEQARDYTRSQVLRDVLIAYWELWYASRAVEIERASLGLAKRRLDEQTSAVAAGDAASVDLLTFSSRVSSLEQALALALLSQSRASTKLSLLLGRGGELALAAGASSPHEVTQLSGDKARDLALAESPEIAQLKAQRLVAGESIVVARDAERSRLDLSLRLQAQGLGAGELWPAVEQFGTFAGTGAFVSLTYERPLANARSRAKRRGAELTRDSITAQLEGVRVRIRSDVATESAATKAARRRIELASQAVDIARKQREAQDTRFREGDGIALEVHEAEDNLRAAQLGVARAEVDLMGSQLRLAHLTGELLGRYTQPH